MFPWATNRELSQACFLWVALTLFVRSQLQTRLNPVNWALVMQDGNMSWTALIERRTFMKTGKLISQSIFKKGRLIKQATSRFDLLCMGYWPSVRSRWLDIGQVLFCVFMNRDGVEVHKLAKKERGQYQAILTEQARSIKDLLYGFRGNFSCGTQRVVPSAGFDSSCPLTELAI